MLGLLVHSCVVHWPWAFCRGVSLSADDTQPPEVFGGGEEPHSFTLMETSLKSIHAGLKIVEDYQTHHRLVSLSLFFIFFYFYFLSKHVTTINPKSGKETTSDGLI